MVDIPVFEYLDGYEDEDDRPRIHYIALGYMNNGKSIVICYVEEHPHVATIGRNIHNKAWIHSHMKLQEGKQLVATCVENKNKYSRKIQELRKNKDTLDKEHVVTESHKSISTYISAFNVSFHYGASDSYTDKFIEALQQKVQMIDVAVSFTLT
jgi:hypothetical protein